jgi:two-component system response regulator FixJ
MRVALRRFLRAANLDVETFPSGAKFLESLQTHQPDCVVLDLHMPDIDGFAVQARLVEMGIGLPVVVITSAYFPKPVDGQTLLGAIATAIAHPPDIKPPPAKNQPG